MFIKFDDSILCALNFTFTPISSSEYNNNYEIVECDFRIVAINHYGSEKYIWCFDSKKNRDAAWLELEKKLLGEK